MEFSTKKTEAIVSGLILCFAGTGALLFWNVEKRADVWLLAFIGIFLLLTGLFFLGYRRTVHLDKATGVKATRAWFNLIWWQKSWSLSDFTAAGLLISRANQVFLDAVLFRRDGDYLTLVYFIGDEEALQVINQTSHYLGLPAEPEPRPRTFIIG